MKEETVEKFLANKVHARCQVGGRFHEWTCARTQHLPCANCVLLTPRAAGRAQAAESFAANRTGFTNLAALAMPIDGSRVAWRCARLVARWPTVSAAERNGFRPVAARFPV